MASKGPHILKVRPVDPPKTKEEIASNNWYKKMMTDPVYGFYAKTPSDPYKPIQKSSWNVTKKGRKARRARRTCRNNRH
jgi:hypothetical protein